MDDIFKKPDFGPRPANYRPGIDRGAVPIFTRSDIGPAYGADSVITPTRGTRGHEHEKGEPIADKWQGFKDSSWNSSDDEADGIYAEVDQYMDSRRKHETFKTPKGPAQKRETAAQYFAGTREELRQVTPEMWAALPDSKQFAKKKRRRESYLPVPDFVIASSFLENSNSKGAVLSKQLDMVGSKSIVPSVDPQGYLTSLQSLLPKNPEEVEDLKKARLLAKSLLQTQPDHPEAWINASRIEVKDGKVAAAQEILKKGCETCKHPEELWIELSKISSSVDLAQACEKYPQAVKLWLCHASRQPNSSRKVDVLRTALEHNPESVKLWKQLIGIADEQDAKEYLKKAVTCVPHSVDLWLALAKMLPYNKARAVINKARKVMPSEPLIWTNAAKLEESQGELQNCQVMISRGIQALKNKGVVIDRKLWLKEAQYAEASGNTCTAKSISSQIYEGMPKNAILEDFESSVNEQAFETARTIIRIGLQKFNSKKLWKAAIYLEEKVVNNIAIRSLLLDACRAHPEHESFWIKLLDNCDASMYTEALQHHPSCLKIYKIGIDFERNNWDTMEDLVNKAVLNCEKAWKLMIEFYSDSPKIALQKLLEAIETAPKNAKLYKYASRIMAKSDLKSAIELMEKGCAECPNSCDVWITISRLLTDSFNSILARFKIEIGRLQCKDPKIWVETVVFERKQGNLEYALFMAYKAIKEYPNNGKLWGLAISLEKPKKKKTAIVEALSKCESDPHVILAIADMFREEKHVAKARTWYEKGLNSGWWLGDLWINYYLLEQSFQNYQEMENIRSRIIENKVSKGEVWKKISQKNLSNSEILRFLDN